MKINTRRLCDNNPDTVIRVCRFLNFIELIICCLNVCSAPNTPSQNKSFKFKIRTRGLKNAAMTKTVSNFCSKLLC